VANFYGDVLASYWNDLCGGDNIKDSDFGVQTRTCFLLNRKKYSNHYTTMFGRFSTSVCYMMPKRLIPFSEN
jgi:hypothetical protein